MTNKLAVFESGDFTVRTLTDDDMEFEATVVARLKAEEYDEDF